MGEGGGYFFKPKRNRMNPTSEQKLIIDSHADLMIVNAMAGTGKTSTLVKFCEERKRENNHIKIAYFAFNSSMAQEAQESFAAIKENMIFCGTMHSYALRNLENSDFFIERVQKNEKLRYMDLLDLANTDSIKALNSLLNAFRKFVNSNKSLETFLVYDEDIDEIDLDNLLDIYQTKAEIKKIIKKVWETISIDSSYPYEHDFYLKKFQLENPIIQADYILVDEAQDLNPVMLEIVSRQKAKKVFVGDTHQSIYSFRGCVNALEILSNYENAKHFYLTKTFRCPQHIVNKAVPYLSLLGVPQERMLNGLLKEMEYPTEKDKKTIIFRTNAGVFDFLAENQDIKVSFVGGIGSYDFKKIIDVGLSLSNKQEARSRIRDDFLKTLESKEEFLEYLKDGNDIELMSKTNIFLKYIKKEDFNIFDFINKIKDYGRKAEVIVTTAHKSKGLEWDFVELYKDFPNIVEIAESKEQSTFAIEELNLLYVAITRAKKGITIPEEIDISDSRIFNKIKEKIILMGE